jgi:hypothetical protein
LNNLTYNSLSDSVTINEEVFSAKKGFPPAGESKTKFQSNPHYVRIRGKRYVEPLPCIYSYTKESWFVMGTEIPVFNVECWY